MLQRWKRLRERAELSSHRLPPIPAVWSPVGAAFGASF